MGIIRYTLLAAVAAASPTLAVAQDNGVAPVLQDFRLDPARDPNRARTPERSGPEIGNIPDAVPLPSVNAPPVVLAAPPPAVAPTVAPIRPGTAARPAAEIARPTTVPPATPTPSDAAAPDALPPASGVSNDGPPASSDVPAPEARNVSEAASTRYLPWIIGGLIALVLGAFLFLRRRKTEDELELPDEAPAIEVAEPDAVAAVPITRPTVPSEIRPIPAPSIPVSAANPLTLTFTPLHARTTMVGAQLGYSLTLRNESAQVLDGLAVTAFMSNGDAQQRQRLAAFFDDPFAPETHRISAIDAGEEIIVNGELRLDRLVPIELQGRALLIPLVAFKVISLDGDEIVRAAFIVGQESTPPRAKMAPFRLDQGPRQFRDIGSRPAQDLVAA